MTKILSYKDNLLKEASDLINDLGSELQSARTKITKLETDLRMANQTLRKDKLANDLESKGLVTYEELEKIKNEDINEDEMNRLEKLSEYDMSYVTEKYTPNQTNVENSYPKNDENYITRTQYLIQNLTI